jgi:hypothetical protein
LKTPKKMYIIAMIVGAFPMFLSIHKTVATNLPILLHVLRRVGIGVGIGVGIDLLLKIKPIHCELR